MARLIFDIETAGEDFDQMDETTKEFLKKRVAKSCGCEEEINEKMEKIKEELVFSPLTGRIVAAGVMDHETKKGAVYFQPGEAAIEEFEHQGIVCKSMEEREILENFWRVAKEGSEFISFNGRTFDVPFLMIRSAIHGIKPTKNLEANRYLSLQPANAKHIDLMDQLNFYGAVWGRTNLHLTCRAFGIESPKEDGVDGDDVTRLFGEGKIREIVEYNIRDLVATDKLFAIWNKYLRF